MLNRLWISDWPADTLLQMHTVHNHWHFCHFSFYFCLALVTPRAYTFRLIFFMRLCVAIQLEVIHTRGCSLYIQYFSRFGVARWVCLMAHPTQRRNEIAAASQIETKNWKRREIGIRACWGRVISKSRVCCASHRNTWYMSRTKKKSRVLRGKRREWRESLEKIKLL